MRGLFRDDVVYGISTTGVYAYDLNAFDAGAIGQVSLPAPVYDNGYGYGGKTEPGIALPPSMQSAPDGSAGTPTPPESAPDSAEMTAAEAEEEEAAE